VKNEQITECMCLDMLFLVDARGNVLYRASNPVARGDNVLWDPVIGNALIKNAPVVNRTDFFGKNRKGEPPALGASWDIHSKDSSINRNRGETIV